MKYYLVLFVLYTPNVISQSFDYLPGTNQIVEYSEFTLSYNEEHEQPNWVAYELTKQEVLTKRERCNCFKADKKILTGSATLADYKGSGYDRGHLAPSAANKITEQANEESFLMSNMSPQLAGFNRYIWKDLESKIRDFAINNNVVYVVTGPVFKNNIARIGTNKVTVPGYYYKVVLVNNENQHKAIAFLLKHEASKEKLTSFVVTVDHIEALTGIDFFPELEDNMETELESKIDVSKWDWN